MIDGPFDTEGSTKPRSGVAKTKLRPPEYLFIWSAADEEALKRLLKLYATKLDGLQISDEPQEFLRNLAYTLSARRSLLRWRSCAVASTSQELLQTLRKTTPEPTRSNSNCRVAFIFTGQGAQWHAMGNKILEYPVYRESVNVSQNIFSKLGCTWSSLGKFSYCNIFIVILVHDR